MDASTPPEGMEIDPLFSSQSDDRTNDDSAGHSNDSISSHQPQVLLKRRRPEGNDVLIPLDPSDLHSGSPSWQNLVPESLVTPNFEELARRFPEFGSAWRQVQQEQARRGSKQSSSSSSSSAAAPLESVVTQRFSVALTRALLHIHWGLSLPYLPLTNLCPPVPNRFFLIRWIQCELLPTLSNPAYFSPRPRDATLTRGLDIGTGATCIYPLLYAASSSSSAAATPCHVYSTDVDTASVDLARQNVASNATWAPHITVLPVPPTHSQQQQSRTSSLVNSENPADHPMELTTTPGTLDPGRLHPYYPGPLLESLQVLPNLSAPLDFVLTNPPFYDGVDDDSTSRHRPRSDGVPRTAMTGSEGTYPGGEVGFVQEIMADTLYLYLLSSSSSFATTTTTTATTTGGPAMPPEQQVPGWICCMCGKKSSWIQLKHLAEHYLGRSRVRSAEFGPGHLTRWFLAWTTARPAMTSPWARVVDKKNGSPWSLVVAWTPELLLPPEPRPNDPTQASEYLVARIQQFCQEVPDRNLMAQVISSPPLLSSSSSPAQRTTMTTTTTTTTVHLYEVNPSAWMDEQQDPIWPAAMRALWDRLDPNQVGRRSLIPPQGHFLIQLSWGWPQRDGTLPVHLQSYAHTSYGRQRIEHYTRVLPGELGRTNRRWRRRLQREQGGLQQQQEQQPPQSPTENGGRATMDHESGCDRG